MRMPRLLIFLTMSRNSLAALTLLVPTLLTVGVAALSSRRKVALVEPANR